MSPRVSAAFAVNDGLLTRERLLDLAVPPSEIKRMRNAGELVTVRRGVYTPAEIWDALDPFVGRPRMRARAAILNMRRGWVLSHDSAAHELGMAILTPREPFVHITRPGFTNAWTENGVKHHLARFAESQLVQVNGMSSLDLARTAVDIARERGLWDGVVACDSALRMGVGRADLERAYEPMDNWPNVIVTRECVRLADAGATNPHESMGRLLVLESGIGKPETQFPVWTAEGVKWCDLRVGNLVIETDGRVKYRSADAGGVALKSADDVAWDERKRERLVRDRNLGVVRLYWEDYWGRRRIEAISRLRAEYADTVARFGSKLAPELASEAAQIREGQGA